MGTPAYVTSLPAVVDRSGVQSVNIDMPEHEADLLQRSAAAVRSAAQSLGL